MRKSKSEIVLRALQFGLEVKFPFCGMEYEIILSNNNVFFKGKKCRRGLPDEDILLSLDMSITEFLAGCDAIPDDEITKLHVH